MGPEFLRKLGSAAEFMDAKQISVLTDMLRKGDEAGAAQYMQYIEAALRTDGNVPRGPRGVRFGSTARSVPGSREVIPYTPSKPQVRVAPRRPTWQAPGNDLIRRLAEAGAYGGGAYGIYRMSQALSEDSGGPAGRAGGRGGASASDKPWELMSSEEYLQHLRSKGFE